MTRRRPARGPPLRLRHHARTTPPTWATRRPTSRSTCCAGPGSTPGTASTTSRTSPTSTTRCWSAPTETGVDWRELARATRPSCSARTWRRCGCCRPTHYVGAVEAIPAIVGAASSRLRGPRAPRTGSGRRHLLLRARRPGLRRRSPAWTRRRCWRCSPSAAATRTAPGKKDPLDSLLWRAARPGEPALGRRPLGRGRPGWHIECAAIALEHLGDGLRRPGRRLRPGLPAPRDGRVRTAQVLDRRAPVRAAPTSTPAWSGSTARRCRSPRATSSSSPQLRRGRGGPDRDPARPARAPLPRRLGVDRRRVWPRRSSGSARWRAAVSLPDGPDAERPARASVRARPGRRPGRAGRAGRRRPLGGSGPGRRQQRPGRRRQGARLVRDAVDALLGVAL